MQRGRAGAAGRDDHRPPRAGLGRADARARRRGRRARAVDALAAGADPRRAVGALVGELAEDFRASMFPDPDGRRHRPRAARARARGALRPARPPPAAPARNGRGVPPGAGARAAARLPAPVHHLPARRRRRRLARPGRRRGREPPTSLFNAVAWPYVHLRGRHAGPPTRPDARRRRARPATGSQPTKGGPEMSLPYAGAADPARARPAPDPRAAAPRRARRPPCAICGGEHDDARSGRTSNWTLHPPVGGSLPGAVWLASREHVDSFADLPRAARRRLRPRRRARVERAILALGDVGRVHLYRWGDGGAHFHVWFLPRPLGMARGGRDDAAALGGRAAERVRTRSSPAARRSVVADRDVTRRAARPPPRHAATRSSSGSAR